MLVDPYDGYPAITSKTTRNAIHWAGHIAKLRLCSMRREKGEKGGTKMKTRKVEWANFLRSARALPEKAIFPGRCPLARKREGGATMGIFASF